MAAPSTLRHRHRRKAGRERSNDEPDDQLRNAEISRTRRALLAILIVSGVALYVALDRAAATSAVLRLIWEESYRAALLHDPHPRPGDNPLVIQLTMFDSAGGTDQREVMLITERSWGSGPVLEMLAHWMAGGRNIRTTDEDEFRVDAIELEIPIPSLDDSVTVGIQKRRLDGRLQFESMAPTALNLFAIASTNETSRSEWSKKARQVFESKCQARKTFGSFVIDRSTLQESTRPSERLRVQQNDFDFIATLRYEGYGKLPSMALHTSYSLRYAPVIGTDTNEEFVFCSEFVPEMQWIDGAGYAWRDGHKLAAGASIANYLTIDSFAPSSEFEKLVDKARSDLSEVPTVGESVPASIVASAAPLASIFLAILASMRVRQLEHRFPGGSWEAFFGRPASGTLRLSWLDGPHLRALERMAHSSVCITAALAPLILVIAIPLSFFFFVLEYGPMTWERAWDITRFSAHLPFSNVWQAALTLLALLTTLHLLGIVWRSARPRQEPLRSGH